MQALSIPAGATYGTLTSSSTLQWMLPTYKSTRSPPPPYPDTTMKVEADPEISERKEAKYSDYQPQLLQDERS